MDTSGRRHTRLALVDLASATTVYDAESDKTNLTLSFKNTESAVLSLPKDNKTFLTGIGNWLINYSKMANYGSK